MKITWVSNYRYPIRRRKKDGDWYIYQNALNTKTLKERIKTQRKIVSHSNSTRAMLLVWERLPLNYIFPYAYVGLVWFARYCGKMYSRHLFFLPWTTKSLRTIAPIATAHRYCARKFTRHVIHRARALSNKINK